MRWNPSLESRGLTRKLLVAYFLMFVLPVSYLVYVVWHISCEMGLPRTELVYIRMSMIFVLPAMFAGSLAAFVLLYRTIRSIATAAEQAESFILKEMPAGKAEPVRHGDEAEKISCYVADMIKELREKLVDVDRFTEEISAANVQLADMAVSDGLTGLYNHKHVKHLLGIEFDRAARLTEPLAVLMLDVDNFKAFNDSCGHLAGDKALQAIAKVIKSSIRQTDVAARYGGEEFMAVLHRVNGSTAVDVAERIRTSIEKYIFEGPERRRSEHLTISIGISGYPSWVSSREELIAAADARLYEAKNKGRNRVCF